MKVRRTLGDEEQRARNLLKLFLKSLNAAIGLRRFAHHPFDSRGQRSAVRLSSSAADMYRPLFLSMIVARCLRQIVTCGSESTCHVTIGVMLLGLRAAFQTVPERRGSFVLGLGDLTATVTATSPEIRVQSALKRTLSEA
jgi:hypothetical protein